MAWIAGMGVALVYLFANVKHAYDVNAFGSGAGWFVRDALWAITVVVLPLANAVGIVATSKTTWEDAAAKVVNATAGRIAIIALSLVFGTVLLIAASRTKPVENWTCTITSQTALTKPDPVRCGDGTFAQMRWFVLRVRHASDNVKPPTLQAQALDRSTASFDSSSGGECSTRGPNWPTQGHTEIILKAACGADRTYDVNLYLCDPTLPAASASNAAQVRTAVKLEIVEEENAHVIACE